MFHGPLISNMSYFRNDNDRSMPGKIYLSSKILRPFSLSFTFSCNCFSERIVIYDCSLLPVYHCTTLIGCFRWARGGGVKGLGGDWQGMFHPVPSWAEQHTCPMPKRSREQYTQPGRQPFPQCSTQFLHSCPVTACLLLYALQNFYWKYSVSESLTHIHLM